MAQKAFQTVPNAFAPTRGMKQAAQRTVQQGQFVQQPQAPQQVFGGYAQPQYQQQQAFQQPQTATVSPMAGYDDWVAAYQADNERAKFNMTKDQADKNLQMYDEMLETISGDEDLSQVGHVTTSIDKVLFFLSQTVSAMKKPEIWFPEEMKAHMESFVKTGEKLAPYIEQYAGKVNLLKKKAESAKAPAT